METGNDPRMENVMSTENEDTTKAAGFAVLATFVFIHLAIFFCGFSIAAKFGMFALLWLFIAVLIAQVKK